MTDAAQEPFVTEHFETAESFLRALRRSDSRWKYPDPTLWPFRGQANAEWFLAPTLARTRPFGFLYPVSAHLYEAIRPGNAAEEVTLLIDFLHTADRHGLAVPEDTQRLRALDKFHDEGEVQIGRWPPPHVISLMALAQHHGLPTRMLDWSWNPPVAAYFACLEPRSPAACLSVWAVQTNFIKGAWRFNALADEDPLFPAVELVTAPQASNRNLAAQAGLFTLVRGRLDESFDLAGVISERVNLVGGFRDALDMPVLRKLCLPRTEVKALLRQLAYEGTTAASIFPGYDGVVKSMQERHLWHPIGEKVAALKANRKK